MEKTQTVCPVRFYKVGETGLVSTHNSSVLWYWRAYINGVQVARAYAGWSSEAAAKRAAKKELIKLI